MRLPTGSILGQFAKGILGSLSINFSISGGANCDDSCQHKGATCYAERIEKRPDRSQLLAKLARHSVMPPAILCGRAILEIQKLLARDKRIPWLRISTNGSLPQPEVARKDSLFKTQFRALIALAHAANIPVHIPAETFAKTRFYQSLIGDLATVRESAQTQRRFLQAKNPCSFVAPGNGYRQRIVNARQLAKKRYEISGRKTIVCPAVVNSFNVKLKESAPNPKAHCGACTACAQSQFDIVYPLH